MSSPSRSMAARVLRPVPNRWGRWIVPALVVAALPFVTPAARAASSADSSATLTWTAPGDDGTTGRATRYELRMRSTAIAGTDTLAWWNAATLVPSVPSPGAPGTVDSVQVRGLDPVRTWWFVLRTADEVPNWSGFSNMAVRPPYVDLMSPAAITDLRLAAAAAAARSR